MTSSSILAHDLAELVEKALIDMISDHVVARLHGADQTALVLFDDCDYGLVEAGQSLQRLCDEGWRLDIVATKEARSRIPMEILQYVDLDISKAHLDQRVQDNAVLIVPNMSLNLAAKAAMGIRDCPMSQGMGIALESGRSVVAVRDGCCPVCRERVAEGKAANPSYNKMMSSHLIALDSFGVRLCWAKQLCDTVIGCCNSGSRVSQIGSERPAEEQSRLPEVSWQRQLLSWGDAKAFRNQTLRVGFDVVITPSAAEELRAHNVQVVRG